MLKNLTRLSQLVTITTDSPELISPFFSHEGQSRSSTKQRVYSFLVARVNRENHDHSVFQRTEKFPFVRHSTATLDMI